MSGLGGNGAAKALALAEATADDQRDLRQLFMSEMRAMRADLRALTEQVRDTGRAVDTLLDELRLRDKEEEGG